jgi:hypothetical protein|eukprot:COSAG01_NODE_4120_length_5332_cov_18.963310_5_plen_177_part_00
MYVCMYWSRYHTNVSDTTYAVDAEEYYLSAAAADFDFDSWAAASARSGGYHLHPSSRLWQAKDSGSILDDDGIGHMVPSRAAEWCVEAVQPGNLEVWVSPLSELRHPHRSRWAVSLLNRSPTAQNITVGWGSLGLSPMLELAVRDVWAKHDMGVHRGSYNAEVDAHDVALLVLTST